MAPVFESATGIVLRGFPDDDLAIEDGQLVAVLTINPRQERLAKARFGPVDSFTKLGPLRGYEGSHDILLEWQPKDGVDLDALQCVIIGGATYYTPATA